MVTKDIRQTVENIKEALADPDAPWYGSDLIPLVADLIEDWEWKTRFAKLISKEISLLHLGGSERREIFRDESSNHAGR